MGILDGRGVGMADGILVGDGVGSLDGLGEGIAVGLNEGHGVGSLEGLGDGIADGILVGIGVGTAVGFREGSGVGFVAWHSRRLGASLSFLRLCAQKLLVLNLIDFHPTE